MPHLQWEVLFSGHRHLLPRLITFPARKTASMLVVCYLKFFLTITENEPVGTNYNIVRTHTLSLLSVLPYVDIYRNIQNIRYYLRSHSLRTVKMYILSS